MFQRKEKDESPIGAEVHEGSSRAITTQNTATAKQSNRNYLSTLADKSVFKPASANG